MDSMSRLAPATPGEFELDVRAALRGQSSPAVIGSSPAVIGVTQTVHSACVA